jgi:hypothetical protein
MQFFPILSGSHACTTFFSVGCYFILTPLNYLTFLSNDINEKKLTDSTKKISQLFIFNIQMLPKRLP